MADQSQPPLTRIQQKNRDLILEGALSVCSVNGFRGATIDQIADAAGPVEERGLNHHRRPFYQRHLGSWAGSCAYGGRRWTHPASATW